MQYIITGPECSGKTTLAKALSKRWQIPWLPEYARTYLETLQRPYTENDLIHIARGQWQQEEYYIRQNKPFICDTSIEVIKIWAQVKYGYVHPEIEAMSEKNQASYYFLCGIDIPWEYDPLRENAHNRHLLYNLYRQALIGRKQKFTELWGSIEQRILLAEMGYPSKE